jgi:hypothetical protein
MQITWQPGFGPVRITTHQNVIRAINGVHSAGQMKRDRNGRLRNSHGRYV